MLTNLIMPRFMVAKWTEGYGVSCLSLTDNVVMSITPKTLTKEVADDVCARLNTVVEELAA